MLRPKVLCLGAELGMYQGRMFVMWWCVCLTPCCAAHVSDVCVCASACHCECLCKRLVAGDICRSGGPTGARAAVCGPQGVI
jgi:hypothetical protein